MRIGQPRVVASHGWTRLVAAVELADTSTHELFFEVPNEYRELLSVSVDAFVPSTAVLACRLGETVLEVSGASPQLVHGTETALRWLSTWYQGQYSQRVRIRNSDPISARGGGARAASLLSGGIDSLALIRRNHLSHAEHDVDRVTVGIIVNWNAGSEDSAIVRRRTYFDNLSTRLSEADLGVDVVQVRSNLMSLVRYPSGPWWGRAWHGACFAGVAHAMGGGVSSVRIGSTYRLEDLKPWGSHPLIDNELSSPAVRFIHDGLTLSRSEKTELVSKWPAAAAVASVCIGDYDERLQRWNCGHCEKCIRTAASFVAAGAPEAARALIGRDVTPKDVVGLRLSADITASFWSDIARAAEESGAAELAAAADGIVTSYRRRKLAHRVAGPLGIRRLRARLRT